MAIAQLVGRKLLQFPLVRGQQRLSQPLDRLADCCVGGGFGERWGVPHQARQPSARAPAAARRRRVISIGSSRGIDELVGYIFDQGAPSRNSAGTPLKAGGGMRRLEAAS